MKKLGIVGVLVTLLLSACGTQEPTAVPDKPAPSVATKAVVDKVVGVAVTVPKDWVVQHDKFTDGTYGFILTERNDNEHDTYHPFHPVLRVALVDGATPDQIGKLVKDKLEEYPELELEPTKVKVGGVSGVAVGGLPAPEGQYSVAYVGVKGRVYNVGVWQGLGAEAQRLFDTVAFETPTRSLKSLRVPDLKTYLKTHGLPEVGQKLELDYSRTGGTFLAGAIETTDDTELSLAPTGVQAGCAAQPSGLPWQTQWIDDANAFGSRGWSRMGYASGGFFNEGYHVGCAGGYHQFYAVDYGLQRGAKLYAATPGRVTWVGARNDSYWSLGIFVDVRTTVGGASYTSRSAHLSSVNVRKGQTITTANLPYVVIGRAGSTGAATGPHLHAAVFKNASLGSSGPVYGGTSVKMTKMRCFGCSNYDVDAPGAGGYYTRFYRQRWLKW